MNNYLFKKDIKYVFIDWHGILGDKGFWCNQSKHNSELSKFCKLIFQNSIILSDWMRNKITTEDLINIGSEKFNFSRDFLVKSFDADVAEYGPKWKLCKFIDKLFPNSKKILFSDNPLIFKERVLNKNRKLINYFDKIILSCDYGMLKLEKGKNLFDVAKNELKLSGFQNCVLLDDKQENCLYFKNNGNGFYINIS